MAVNKIEVFQSTRPVRGATSPPPDPAPDTPISIHAPRAGRDPDGCPPAHWQRDFNPRAPCGARRRSSMISRRRTNFNPRAPCGARLSGLWVRVVGTRFQSTRPVRGATVGRRAARQRVDISIHAPRAGRDFSVHHDMTASNISIHAPRAGRDRRNPYAPLIRKISIHAPRAGRDSRPFYSSNMISNFNPRAPCGARRRNLGQLGQQQ